jgi:hypothetical protein
MTPSTSTTTTTVKPRIRVLGPARYLVESTTRPGLGHHVEVLRLRCGCEAGKYGLAASGLSREAIARLFNEEAVPSPPVASPRPAAVPAQPPHA